MANLRRDSARRSYRSRAANCFVSFDRIVANLADPSCAVVRNLSMKAGSRNACQLGRQKLSDDFKFHPRQCSELITVAVGHRLGKELTARITYAAQIDLRFGDLACEHLDMSAGVPPSDLKCEGLHFFRKRLV